VNVLICRRSPHKFRQRSRTLAVATKSQWGASAAPARPDTERNGVAGAQYGGNSRVRPRGKHRSSGP